MESVRVFGGSSTVLSTSYDPVLSSWKTSQQSLFEDFQQSLEVLPKSGMTVSGRLYLLNNVEHPTLEDDGLQSRIPAESQTEQGLLPTPTKTGSEHRTRYSQGGRPLMYMIQKGLLPTPSAHEHKYRLKGNSQASKCLEARARRTGKDFQLNPQFVEEMMGFPIGWTDLNHSETQSSHSAQNGSDNK